MQTKLSVNLNAVAQLRNRRDLPWPSVTGMGRIALAAGAHGLTIHPRPDQRHIRFTDVPALRELISNEFPDREFNIEGYPTEQFIELVLEHKPEQVTLVPDDPAQATSDHGWDFTANHNLLSMSVDRLHAAGMRVSLFADPDPGSVVEAVKTGCDRIELYTGPYGATYDDAAAAQVEIERLAATAQAAEDAGLGVNAGHDLTVENLPALLQQTGTIAEVSIGHGLTARALERGMDMAVRDFLAACGVG